jgi:heat shock protein HslJ
MATDIPYAFGDNPYSSGYTSNQLEKLRASSPDLANVSPISNAVSDPELYNSRVEPENPIVHDQALRFAGANAGTHTIGQICSIYEYLRFGDASTKGWIYTSNPRGTDYYAYANETLKLGKEIGCTGTGNCNDFAITMSALMESIGGTTRIINACGSDGCHAYTEIYLGQLNAPNNQVIDIINSLKQAYGTDKIYVHIDPITWDVWLNLDWWADHPGGNFFQGDTTGLFWIRSMYGKIPVNASDISLKDSMRFSNLHLQGIWYITGTMEGRNTLIQSVRDYSGPASNGDRWEAYQLLSDWELPSNGVSDDEQITLMLNQNGTKLYGKAKRIPATKYCSRTSNQYSSNPNNYCLSSGSQCSEIPWNANVTGLIYGNKVRLNLDIKPLSIGDHIPEMVNLPGATITLDGTFGSDSFSGTIAWIDDKMQHGNGTFMARFQSPDTSEYIPYDSTAFTYCCHEGPYP